MCSHFSHFNFTHSNVFVSFLLRMEDKFFQSILNNKIVFGKLLGFTVACLYYSNQQLIARNAFVPTEEINYGSFVNINHM